MTDDEARLRLRGFMREAIKEARYQEAPALLLFDRRLSEEGDDDGLLIRTLVGEDVWQARMQQLYRETLAEMEQ